MPRLTQILLVLAAVGVFAAAPAGAASTDRHIKWCLAERLHEAPRLVILGSSRSVKVEPSYLTSLTGLPAFNTGTSGGGLADDWAFANFMHDRFPSVQQHTLWLLDVEQLRRHDPHPDLLKTQALAQYLHPLTPAEHAAVAEPVRCTFTTSPGTVYSPRGLRAVDSIDRSRARGVPFQHGLDWSIRYYSKVYRSKYPRIDPLAEQRLEQTLAALNGWHDDPVIVLTPAHPAFLAAVGPLGWYARHRAVLRYLRSLHDRYQFTVLDATDIRRFGGKPDGFLDGVHMTIANTRRLAHWVVAKAGWRWR